MTDEYVQALKELERLRKNRDEVGPDFEMVVDLELQAAELRVMTIIKEQRKGFNNVKKR